MNYIHALAVLGLLLSIYALHTEYRLRKNRGYKPVCDISKDFSCSKAFLSEYGKLGGISNSLGGIFYYSAILLLQIFAPNFILPLTLVGFLGSIVLAYLSIVKLRTFCLVCNAIYIINTLLFVLNL